MITTTIENEYLPKVELRSSLWEGEVVDSSDPLQRGRIKVHINGLTRPANTVLSSERSMLGNFWHAIVKTITKNEDEETMKDELLPWYAMVVAPGDEANGSSSAPDPGARVIVQFPDNDFYNGIVIGAISSKPASDG